MGEKVMRVSTLVKVAVMAMAIPSLPYQAHAQAPSQQGGTVRVGTLRCDVAGSTAFIFGSTRTIACDFLNVNGRRERYTGEISRYGVDLGFTKAAVMLWAVAAPTTDVQPGVLAGTFVGASGGVTVGVGVGANVLVGGSNRSIELQPLSIEGNTGLNLALGVAELKLEAAQ
jgi:hypothetical protein